MTVRTAPFVLLLFPPKPVRHSFERISKETELRQSFRFSEQTRKRRDVNQDRQPLTAIPQRLVSSRCAAWQLRSPENRESTDSRVVLSRAALLALNTPPYPNSPNSPTLCPCRLPPSSSPHRGPLTGNLVPRM